ncbi:MAG: acyl-ACP desaturase [Candidatus Glassbacteria bacterium]|nr:acyl-ACP desaturase [Candidatus Glassbacteria bacterium]
MIFYRDKLDRACEFVNALRGNGADGDHEEQVLARAFGAEMEQMYVGSPEVAEVLLHAEHVLTFRNHIASELSGEAEKNLRFLLGPEKLWQPSRRDSGPADGLPDFSGEDWKGKIHKIQEYAAGLPSSFFIVLIGNMVTEEALPNYKTALDKIAATGNLSGADTTPWAEWSCGWTAEEDRHGTVLRDYLSYTGKADMVEVDKSVASLLRKGFNLRIGLDPYKLFIYTSFQERATKISHQNTGKVAEKYGDPVLSKICAAISGDESRHETFYKNMMRAIFENDPEGGMLAFERLLCSQVVMPAELMEDGEPELYKHFSLVAQKERVYTTSDYVSIIEHLIGYWDITNRSVAGAAARAQEFICSLPERYSRTLVPRMERLLSKFAKRKYAWLYGEMV